MACMPYDAAANAELPAWPCISRQGALRHISATSTATHGPYTYVQVLADDRSNPFCKSSPT
jgi:hypothetical protein